jgi:hypothetical protein
MTDELEDKGEPIVEETPVIEETTPVVEDGTKETSIPQYLKDAGLAAGLDEATVQDLATNDLDRLKDLGMAYLSSKFRADRSVTEDKAPERVEETPPEQMGHVSVQVPENADANTKSLIEALVMTQNKMIDAFNGDRQKVFELERKTVTRDSQTQAEFDARIDGFFDKQAADIPKLGLTKTLGPDNIAARQEVYAIARVLKGATLEDRLEKATQAYNGMNGNAEASLRRKLDKQKTRFSPRPTGQKSSTTYKNADDAAMAEMKRIASEIGLKFNE